MAVPGGDALLRGLDDAQREAVTTTAAPLAVLAAAGSGKTRVLTRRIAWRIAEGTADGDHVLAVTFTRQAAGELVARLQALGVRDRLTVGTFHAVAWSLLRQRWADTGRRPPELLTDRGRLVAEITGGRDPSEAAAVGAEIDWAKARLVTPEGYEQAAADAGRRGRVPAPVVAARYTAYEQAKRRRRLLDFDDLLVALLRELRDPAWAEVVRWRFRHLFLDEAQDVNPAQVRVLEAVRGGRVDLCLVGDPRQAIYGWNGADPSFLTEVAARYSGITIVRLERAYRSSPAIVRAARAVLPTPEATGVAVADDLGVPGDAPPTVHAYADEQDEARGVARSLRAADVGRAWSQLAVLARTNAQLPLLRRALEAAGLPVAAPPAWLEHPAVREALEEAAAATALDSWLAELAARRLDPELAEDDARALDALAARAARLAATGVVTDGRWLRAGLAEEPAGGIELLTFHAAKGREWPVVIVTGCEAGLVPHAAARTAAARAEEARLLHVALTRAGRELHVTWARRRGGQGRERSPLLDALDAAIAAPIEESAVPPPAWAAPERRPADAGIAGAELDRLRAWRRRRATVLGLPEEAVLSDRALAAVVAAAPADIPALAAVDGVGPLVARRLGASLLDALSGPGAGAPARRAR